MLNCGQDDLSVTPKGSSNLLATFSEQWHGLGVLETYYVKASNRKPNIIQCKMDEDHVTFACSQDDLSLMS